MNYLNFLAAFLTGIFAAMGIGGGMILIIYLTFFADMPQLSAQGVNLLYFIPIALFSVILHSKNKLIEWKKIIPSLILGIIFAVIGAYSAEYIGSELLQKLFGAFIVVVGIKEIFGGIKNSP